MAGKIQNEDVKTLAEITGAGGTAAQLTNDTKIYVTALSINKQLSQAITDGDIGGSRQVSTFSGTSVSPSATKKDETFLYNGGSQQTFTGLGTLSGLTNGYRATIMGSDDTNTLLINENDATNGWLMNGPIELSRGRIITFEYNSTIARMIEIGRT